MPTSTNDFGDAVATTNEFGDDAFGQLPEGDLRAVKEVPSEYGYLPPLPPITAEQLGEEHVSEPALPLPSRVAPPTQAGEYDYLPPLPKYGTKGQQLREQLGEAKEELGPVTNFFAGPRLVPPPSAEAAAAFASPIGYQIRPYTIPKEEPAAVQAIREAGRGVGEIASAATEPEMLPLLPLAGVRTPAAIVRSGPSLASVVPRAMGLLFGGQMLGAGAGETVAGIEQGEPKLIGGGLAKTATGGLLTYPELSRAIELPLANKALREEARFQGAKRIVPPKELTLPTEPSPEPGAAPAPTEPPVQPGGPNALRVESATPEVRGLPAQPGVDVGQVPAQVSPEGVPLSEQGAGAIAGARQGDQGQAGSPVSLDPLDVLKAKRAAGEPITAADIDSALRGTAEPPPEPQPEPVKPPFRPPQPEPSRPPRLPGRPVPEAPAEAPPAVEEAAPEAPKPALSKEPWQMTQRDYVNSNVPRRLLKSANNVRALVRVTAAQETVHRQAVEEAVREGKPVPDDVLADYPDLKPASAAQTTPAPVAKAQAEVTRVARTEGKRSAKDIKAELIQRLEGALKDAPDNRVPVDMGMAPRTVTFEIPGDGTFNLVNTKQAIGKVLESARRIATDRGRPSPIAKPGYQDAALRLKADMADAVQVYGDIGTAYRRLSNQLERAADLGLEQAQANHLKRLVNGLKEKIDEPWQMARTATREAERVLEYKQKQHVRTTEAEAVLRKMEHLEEIARLKRDGLLAETEPPAPPTGAAPSPFFPRRSEAQGLGEPALPPTVEDVRRQRAIDQTGVPPKAETEHARTSPTADPFERARAGDDSAFDDLDAQFREIFPEPDEYAVRGRPNPHQVHTPKQFADRFNTAFAARDFQTILDTIKATSDVSIWKPFLKDLFAKQATDPIAAKKAEWFRHVFNGTVPPDAIPRTARPTPAPAPAPTATPPTPGAPPPPPPPPPAPPPQRIAVAPISGGGAKSPFKIIEDFENAIKKSIRIRRLKRNQLGVYSPGSTLTAERFAGDLDTTAHELAGHWSDDRHGIGKPWIAPGVRSPYDTELAKFWIHGSVTPTSTLRYRRAEGIAEYIRAYVVNPTQAKADAPNFTAYFERTIPDDALKAIKDFSDDVRRWAGEDPLIRAGLNMRMDPPTLRERLMLGLRGRGFGFETNWLDKFRLWFDDPYHYAVKAFHEMHALRGGQLLPKDNFELLSRLLATHDARMSDQFEHGLTPLRPTQTVNPAGKLEVDRLIDPVTKEPMTMEWLVGAFDTTNKAKMLQDMRDASAYMIAQRTIEKGAQLGRDINVSGIGAGILSDKQAAHELLNRVAADPVREARLKEAARRYRLWADQNLDMLVDAGRLTPERAQKIRDDNQQYVDMHRLSQEFEHGFAAQRGGKVGTAIGSAKAVIKRFKGSTLELDNVYSNLLEQTDAIQKEAFRNVAMNTFVDGLRNIRELHGPDLKDFDQFGSKARAEDKNTITVYKNGKAEHWKFAPDIHESLRGLGELGTHAFIDLLSLPQKFARYMITHGPSFLLRNIIRDTFERSVVSQTGSKPTDIAKLYTKEELSRYEVFGGGQFGNYIVDQHVWNRELKKAMAELRKDPFNIFVSAGKLKHAWEALSEKSEKLGRIAEFRRAFEHGRTNLGYDDYNAALYAAGEARGLLDFAKAGVVMRSINKLVPFSNARIRGLGKSFSSAYQNPGRFAMNWAIYVLLPTLGIMLWNRKDKKTWDEYLQLPAYRRDFFWNFKVGDYWMMIPKPHLLGVLAGGVERMILRAIGDKRSMEGYAGDVVQAGAPVTPIEATGPLKSYLDLYFNRDSFRGYDIIPDWEKDLRLDLRKGTAHASGAGKGIANAINVTGLSVDPRQVDYLLQSYGGLGKILTDVTKRPLGETSLKSTGYFTESPGSSARDVQWVIDWAKENGKLNDPMLKNIRDLRKLSMDAKDVETRARYSAMMRDEASKLRNVLESLNKK